MRREDDQLPKSDLGKDVAKANAFFGIETGGASATEQCGLPDLRSAGVTGERQACGTCFGAQSTIAGEVNNAVADYVLENFEEASQIGFWKSVEYGLSVLWVLVKYKLHKKGVWSHPIFRPRLASNSAEPLAQTTR